MTRVLMVGLERTVSPGIAGRLDCPHLVSELLPTITVENGVLLVKGTRSGAGYLPVSHVLYHGIFENDFDFITAMAVWNQKCLPNAIGMMRARMRVPALVHALQVTRFPGGGRGFGYGGVTLHTDVPAVVKFGQWHCGEGKEQVTSAWRCEQPSLMEPFIPGRAVRIMALGDRFWQINLEGDTWKKSIHADTAAIVEPRPDLVEDTKRLMSHFNLEITGVDYMIDNEDRPHLLEVNHIPNVDRFELITRAYIEYALQWLSSSGVPLKQCP
ncbi:MAG: hypothetical protein JWP03_1898 [Phycisphaerales bacterium]|nr:hypothetical protein [Phycisphaerales bacterium]